MRVMQCAVQSERLGRVEEKPLHEDCKWRDCRDDPEMARERSWVKRMEKSVEK